MSWMMACRRSPSHEAATLPLLLLNAATLLPNPRGAPRAQAHAARRSARLPAARRCCDFLSTALSTAVPTAHV